MFDVKNINIAEVNQKVRIILADISKAGVRVDQSKMQTWCDGLTEKIDRMLAVNDMAGIASPRVCAKWLQDRGVELTEKNKTGFRTGAEVLETIDHPACKLVIEYRSLVSTRNQVKRMLTWGTLVHPNYDLDKNPTGRIYTSDPNLQNITREFRSAIVPSEGMIFVGCDWKNADLRPLAVASGDANMLALLQAGRDPHREVIARMANKPVAEVTDEERKHGKVLNLGIPYGMAPSTVCAQMGLSLDEGEHLYHEHIHLFEDFLTWKRELGLQIARDGYCQTPAGTRRNLLVEVELDDQGKATDLGVNLIGQGTVADLFKVALIELTAKVSGTGGRVVLLNHDAFVIEVPKNKEIEARDLLTNTMEQDLVWPNGNSVPMLTETTVYGEAWK